MIEGEYMNYNKKYNITKEKIIISILVAILVIGITYAYFMIRKSIDFGEINSGNLVMTFEEGSDELILGTATPIYDEDIENKSSYTSFSIGNDGSLDMYTSIYFKDIVMDSELENKDFMWRLEDENGEILSQGSFTNIENNQKYVIKNMSIKSGETKNFKLRIWVKETEEDQSIFDGKNFIARVASVGSANEMNF